MEPQVFHPNTTPEPGEEMSVPKPNPHQRVADMQPNNLGRPRKPWGKIVLTIVILIGLGVGGWYGYKWYQKNSQDKTSLNTKISSLENDKKQLEADKLELQNKKTSPSPTPALSDEQQVTQAATNYLEATVGIKVGKTTNLSKFTLSADKSFAKFNVAGNEGAGAVMYFKKVNSVWTYIFTAQIIGSDQIKQYGLPKDF